jgi:geranylgeranyl reductase family protein
LNLLDHNLHFTTQREDPIVSMTMRDQLDYQLVEAARAAGAKLLSECEVKDVIIGESRAELLTTAGNISASFVVAADGVASLVARKIGWPETRRLIPALECEVSVSDKLLQKFSKTARFDFDIVPNGYGWVFPKKTHLSIGVLSMRRQAINLNKIFEHYLNLIGIDEITHLERHGALIPVRPRAGALMRGRVLLVGDVAGLADPITGEGISFAILSGQLASYALLQGSFQPGCVAEIYQAQLSEKILSELRLGRLLAKLLYDYPRLRALVFRCYGQRLSEAVTDLVMGQQSYRAIVANPFNYLKLLSPWNNNPRSLMREEK